MDNRIMFEDLEYIEENVDMKKFEGKTVMVTGATGLIGYWIVLSLLHYSKKVLNPPKVLAVVRDQKKAEEMFSDYLGPCLKFVVGDICCLTMPDIKVDYIIHGASQTSSKAFIQEPVETIATSVLGTLNVLNIAKKNNVAGMVYLSSMEVYGYPTTDAKIKEGHSTNLDTMHVRSCYPESKRMCENLCASYAAEYGVVSKVVRLTQTFGPGVKYNDCRIFAEFARSVIEKKDIVLHTKGDTKRNYLYTADAVNAIFMILLNGKIGEAYNVANESTYCSIYEMATLVAKKCAEGNIKVRIEGIEDAASYGYAPVLKMNLDTTKVRNLGWNAKFNLQQMYLRMIASMAL